MDTADYSKKAVTKSIDMIFSFINVLKIASETHEFRRWLKNYHKIENDEDIFEGYRFFLMISLKCLIESIVDDSALELEEDDVFFRATAVGIALEDIPNTCEKIIFIKNIWNLARGIRKSKNWEQLEVDLKILEKLFLVFDRIHDNIILTRNISKDDAFRIITEAYIHIFLNDTQRIYPLGNILSSTTKKYPKRYLDAKNVFKGYVYSLQYLWFILLGANRFEESCIKNLHRAPEIYSEEIEDQELRKFFAEFEQISEKGLKKTGKEKLSQIKEWLALDKFFWKIEMEIMAPIEKEIRMKLTIDPLLLLEKVDKSIYRELLSRDNIEDPEYLHKNDKKSIKKQLDYNLLWYEVNTLDIKGVTIFSGVPAFINTLLGAIGLKEYYGIDEKVLVRIFRHPTPERGKYDYSFGIIIGAYSEISDYSGWLIFFNCATDYSGFGGSLYRRTEHFIRKFSEKGLIEVKEFLIDKNVFREYLAERGISSVYQLSLPLIRNYISNFKGRFFEYVFHKWINESGKYNSTRCDFYLAGEEIDCIGITENEIEVFECKLDLHMNEIDKTIEQIRRKTEVIRKEMKKDNVKPNLVVFYDIRPNLELKFRGEGINVIKNFRDKVKDDRIFNGVRKELLELLDYGFIKNISRYKA